MKIICIADQHGKLPDIPPCDILLIGGDICPTCNHNVDFQHMWLTTNFNNWRRNQPAKHCLFVAGNHDFYFQKYSRHNWLSSSIEVNPTYLTYLQDSGIECNGLKIWGSPWQLPFYNWAFNMREEEISKKWQLIPDDTDILLLHGPPYNYGDLIHNEHVGSPSLLKRINEIKPKLVVYGHIHSGRGIYQLGTTTLVNAALLNDNYEMVYKPVSITL